MSDLTKPARTDPVYGHPMVWHAARPQWEMLRREAPDEFDSTVVLNGVVYQSWIPAAPWIFPHEPRHKILRHLAVERWDQILDIPHRRDSEHTLRSLDAILIRWSYSGRDSGWKPWVLGWFGHDTYRFGRTDAELIESFGDYVARARDGNYGLEAGDEGYVQLMGADDLWRWKLCDCNGCARGAIASVAH